MTKTQDHDGNVFALLISLLDRRTVHNPGGTLEPPNLSAMLDKLHWAMWHPGSYDAVYLENLKDSIASAEHCLGLMRAVMSAREPGASKTILESRGSKRRVLSRPASIR